MFASVLVLGAGAPAAQANARTRVKFGNTIRRSPLTSRAFHSGSSQKKGSVLSRMINNRQALHPARVSPNEFTSLGAIIGGGALAYGLIAQSLESAGKSTTSSSSSSSASPVIIGNPTLKTMNQPTLNTGAALAQAEGKGSKRYAPKLNDLFQGNKKWSQEMMKNKPQLMDKLGKGQEPKIMWIGCSDSRVPENTISQMDPGEIFVVRNVANQVQLSDNSVMSAMQFAVGVLGVEDIVVCGHYGCGGCAASMSNNDHGAPLEQWIADIRNVYRMHQKELDAITDDGDRQKRLIQLNTIEQCLNVLKSGPVQSKRAETGTHPRVHACIYDPATGILENLDVDFEKYMSGYRDIYDLSYAPKKMGLVGSIRSAVAA